MSSKSFLLHAFTCILLIMAVQVLMTQLQGNPWCDGTYPPQQSSYCATGTNCDNTLSQADCTNGNYQCIVVVGYYPGACLSGGNKNTQLCNNTWALCTQTYYCQWNSYLGSCACSSVPVMNGGNPVISNA